MWTLFDTCCKQTHTYIGHNIHKVFDKVEKSNNFRASKVSIVKQKEKNVSFVWTVGKKWSKCT